jgi:hypothetical protein
LGRVFAVRRTHSVRSVKICKICGEGYDAFKARDARGRYCSPACLSEARRRHRAGASGAVDDEQTTPTPAIGPAILPPTISLGSHKLIVSLGPELDEDHSRRLV